MGLLATDLDTLSRQLDPHASVALRERLRDVRRAVEDLARLLHLPTPKPLASGRRVAALAEVWMSRLHDLKAARLHGYGPVHPDLGHVLDPRVEELQRRLEALAEAARESPGPRR